MITTGSKSPESDAVDAASGELELLTQIIATIPSGLAVFDATGRCTHANDAAWMLLRVDTHLPLVGRQLAEIFGHEQRTVSILEKAMRDGASVDIPAGLSAGGASIAVRARPANGGLLVYLSDVSDHAATEHALRQQIQINETLNRVGGILAAELDLHRLIQKITDEATALTRAQFGSFFYNVIDRGGESYVLYTLSGAPAEAFANFPMPRNTEVFAPTFRNEGVVRSDDIQQDPRYGKSAPYHGQPKGHLPVHSYLAVSVVSRSGEVLGGLFFGHEKTGIFTERDERIITAVAAQAAVAIDNARLYEAAQAEVVERKQAEEQIAHLNARLQRAMAETHHRVKNNLQVISALADLALDGNAPTVPASALLRIGQHSRSLALLHDMLTHRAAAGSETDLVPVNEMLERLIPLVQASTAHCHIRFYADSLPLSVRDSASLALLVNEALINGSKHGGKELEVRVTAQSGQGHVEICDDGCGFPEGFDADQSTGVGMQLIASVAQHDLRGSVAFVNRPAGGACVMVDFPLPA